MGFFRGPKSELDPPPISKESGAREILRVWGGPNLPQQFALNTTWSDAAAWGILLSDIARHAAKAYAGDKYTEQEALLRIREGLNAEWPDEGK